MLVLAVLLWCSWRHRCCCGRRRRCSVAARCCAAAATVFMNLLCFYRNSARQQPLQGRLTVRARNIVDNIVIQWSFIVQTEANIVIKKKCIWNNIQISNYDIVDNSCLFHNFVKNIVSNVVNNVVTILYCNNLNIVAMERQLQFYFIFYYVVNNILTIFLQCTQHCLQWQQYNMVYNANNIVKSIV